MRTLRSPLQRIRRLIKVVEYLQTGRGFNARDLAEMCGVSRRQMFRDLKSLRESGIQLQYDPTTRIYYLSEPSFLPGLNLNTEETLALVVLATNLGDPSHGLPLLSAACEAAFKLCGGLPPDLQESIMGLANLIEIRVGASSRDPSCGIVLEMLQRSLRERRRLRVHYSQRSHAGSTGTLLNPYRLLYANRRWCAIGHSSRDRAVSILELKRIVKCELLSETYKIPPRFSVEKFLGNAWSLIRDRSKSCKTVIRFDRDVAADVANIIWHKTQTIHWNRDGTMDFRATVDGVEEIGGWILSYGDHAQVIKPASLRDWIAERVRSMSRLYRGL